MPSAGLLVPAGNGRKDIKGSVDSFRGHQQPSWPDNTMLKLKFILVALFAALVHAASVGQSSCAPSFCGNSH